MLMENSFVRCYEFGSVCGQSVGELGGKMLGFGPLSSGSFFFFDLLDFGYKKGHKIFGVNLEGDT